MKYDYNIKNLERESKMFPESVLAFVEKLNLGKNTSIH